MDAQPTTQSEAPSRIGFVINFFAFVGCMLVFGLLVYITYVQKQPDTIDEAAIQIRTERYQDIQLAEEAVLNVDTYDWINEAEGKVRLPVDRAIQLTAQRLSAETAD